MRKEEDQATKMSLAPLVTLVVITESAVVLLARKTRSSATVAAEPWWKTMKPSAVPESVLS